MLWVAQLAAVFGFYLAVPFTPLFLAQDLGLHDSRDLAFWTGLAGGAGGLASAAASPLWGELADRFGPKAMVMRAMLGGGLSLAAISFASSPLELVVLRSIQGAISGMVPASNTFVATAMPRHQVARAMGVLSSAASLGMGLGPLCGGVAASLVDVRKIWIAGGMLLVIGAIPVMLGVQEASIKGSPWTQSHSVSGATKSDKAGTLKAIITLLTVQGLLQVSWTGALLLIPLMVIQATPSRAAVATGLVLAASGTTSTIAGIAYSRIASRWGYVTLTASAAVAMSAGILILGFLPSLVGIVIASLVVGFAVGTLLPVTATMLGLETPIEIQGRAFGLSATFNAVGSTLGPFLAGGAASVIGIPGGLFGLAGVALAMGGVVRFGGREPARRQKAGPLDI